MVQHGFSTNTEVRDLSNTNMALWNKTFPFFLRGVGGVKRDSLNKKNKQPQLFDNQEGGLLTESQSNYIHSEYSGGCSLTTSSPQL